MGKSGIIYLTVEYERSIRYGQDQALQSDVFTSLAMLASNTRQSELYKKVYGTNKVVDLDQVRNAMAAPSYTGGGIIVAKAGLPSAGESIARQRVILDQARGRTFDPPDEKTITVASVVGGVPLKLVPGDLIGDEVIASLRSDTGSPKVLWVRGAEEGDLANISKISGKKYVTPTDLAKYFNALTAAKSASGFDEWTPAMEYGSGTTAGIDWATFDSADFVAGDDGLYPQRLFFGRSGRGERRSMSDFMMARLGEVPAYVSEADVIAIEEAAKVAASFGLRFLSDQVPSLSDRPMDGVVNKYALRADWRVVNDEAAQGASGSTRDTDWLKNMAQRPGGANFDAADLADENASQAVRDATRRGVFVRDAETTKHSTPRYAMLRVVQGADPKTPGDDPYASGLPVKVLFQTNHFLLQGVQEGRAEKHALVPTFADSYIYLFGSQARIYNYSGTLIDTVGLDWLNQWRQGYDAFFRGTKLARSRARVFLIHEDVVREGIILQDGISYTVDGMGTANVSFSLYVIKETFLNGAPYILTDQDQQIDPVAKDQAGVWFAWPNFHDVTSQALGGDPRTSKAIGEVLSDASAGKKMEIERRITSNLFNSDQTQVMAYSGSVTVAPAKDVAEAIDRRTAYGAIWAPGR